MTRLRANPDGTTRPVTEVQARGTRDPRYDTPAWHRIRAMTIAAHPWCVDCGHAGTDTNPLSVDHRIPISKGGNFWGPWNHEVRCRSCNSRKGTKLG